MRMRLLILLFSTSLLFCAIIPVQVGNKWFYKNYYGGTGIIKVKVEIDSIRDSRVYYSSSDTLGNPIVIPNDWPFPNAYLSSFLYPYNQYWLLTDTVFNGVRNFYDTRYLQSQTFPPHDGNFEIHTLTVGTENYNDSIYPVQNYRHYSGCGSSMGEWSNSEYKTAYGLGVISFLHAGGSGDMYSSKFIELYAVEFNGIFTPVSITDNYVERLKLDLNISNYPNPFNPSTTIQFSLAKPSMTELNVYNSSGEVVKTLLKGVCSAGNQQVQFDGCSLASGVYYYRLTTPEQSLSGKMMLIK